MVHLTHSPSRNDGHADSPPTAAAHADTHGNAGASPSPLEIRGLNVQFPSRTVFYTWVNIRCKLPRSLGKNSVQINSGEA